MPKKKCIICREPKEDNEGNFNKEHVFPEAIGGSHSIMLVCCVCNTDMGKYIDFPFLNHTKIKSLRKKYKLKSYGRKIGNPYSQYNDKDAPFYHEITEDGDVYRHHKTTKKTIRDEKGFRVEMSVDEKEWNSPDFLKKIKQRIADEEGVPVESIAMSIDNIEPPSQTTDHFWGSNRPIIMESLKVAHEFAAEQIPQYIDTPLAIEYGKVLKTGIPTKELDRFIVTGSVAIDVVSHTEELAKKLTNNHFVILLNSPTVGSFAVVHFFDEALKPPMQNIITLAFPGQLPNFSPIIMHNDFKKKIAYIEKDGFRIGIFARISPRL